jgi:hypothetical protein
MCRGVVTTSNDNQIAVIEMIQHIFFCEGDHNISGGGGNGMLPCGSGWLLGHGGGLVIILGSTLGVEVALGSIVFMGILGCIDLGFIVYIILGVFAIVVTSCWQEWGGRRRSLLDNDSNVAIYKSNDWPCCPLLLVPLYSQSAPFGKLSKVASHEEIHWFDTNS